MMLQRFYCIIVLLGAVLRTLPVTAQSWAKCKRSFPSSVAAVALGLHVQLVPEPCDASKAADIIFDASFSRDGSGRALVRYQWAAQGNNDVVLNAAISAANAAENGAGSVRWVAMLQQPHAAAVCLESSGMQPHACRLQLLFVAILAEVPVGVMPCLTNLLPHCCLCRLIVPASDLETMKNAIYTIRVTVTNWLGATDATSATFEKVASGQAPVTSVAGGTQQTFKIAEGVQLTSQLVATSVCPGKKVGTMPSHPTIAAAACL